MKLYLNGLLAGTNNHTGSFAWIGGGKHNYLGRSNWHETTPNLNADFKGQMDEVRVWRTARSQTEIRENMLKTLRGNEPGLVGYWNFNDGTAKDSSPGRHHGTLKGNAKIVAGRQSIAQAFIMPTLLTGQVIDADGRPLRNAD